MHVPFRRQPFSGRGELNFIGATNDDAIASLDAGLEASLITIARGDLDVAASEPFAANLDEHVRPSGLKEDGFAGNGGDLQALVFVEDGRSALADEQRGIGEPIPDRP